MGPRDPRKHSDQGRPWGSFYLGNKIAKVGTRRSRNPILEPRSSGDSATCEGWFSLSHVRYLIDGGVVGVLWPWDFLDPTARGDTPRTTVVSGLYSDAEVGFPLDARSVVGEA